MPLKYRMLRMNFGYVKIYSERYNVPNRKISVPHTLSHVFCEVTRDGLCNRTLLIGYPSCGHSMYIQFRWDSESQFVEPIVGQKKGIPQKIPSDR